MGRRSPAFRRLRDEHPVMDVSARDLEIALAGGYPPEYAPFAVAVTLGTPVNVLPATPSGVWRVVLHFAIVLASANTNGAWCGIRHNAAVCPIAGANAWATTYQTTLPRPILLQPGDAPCVAVNVGGPTTVTGGIAYIDVPIPPGGGGEFYRVRRG